MNQNTVLIKVEVDTSQAIAEIDRLKAHLDSVPDFEIEELQEITGHLTWPVWPTIVAGATGGLIVLIAFFIVGTVLS